MASFSVGGTFLLSGKVLRRRPRTTRSFIPLQTLPEPSTLISKKGRKQGKKTHQSPSESHEGLEILIWKILGAQKALKQEQTPRQPKEKTPSRRTFQLATRPARRSRTQL